MEPIGNFRLDMFSNSYYKRIAGSAKYVVESLS